MTDVVHTIVSIALNDENRGRLLRIDPHQFCGSVVVALGLALSKGSTALKAVSMESGGVDSSLGMPWRDDLLGVLARYGKLSKVHLETGDYPFTNSTHCRSYSGDIERLASTNQQLQELTVHSTQLAPCRAFDGFLRAAAWASLRIIELRRCDMRDAQCAAIIERAAEAPCLLRLDLSNNDDAGGPLSIRAINKAARGVTSMVYFAMTEVGFDTDALIAICAAQRGNRHRKRFIFTEWLWRDTSDAGRARGRAVYKASAEFVWHNLDFVVCLEPECVGMLDILTKVEADAVHDLECSNIRTRELFDDDDKQHKGRSTVPLGTGQQIDSGGALAELPNELPCIVASRVWPTRSAIELAHSCRLLRDCVNNYAAWLRLGVSDYRLFYRNARFEQQRKHLADPYAALLVFRNNNAQSCTFPRQHGAAYGALYLCWQSDPRRVVRAVTARAWQLRAPAHAARRRQRFCWL
jgi:hypothetical protein